MRNPLGLPSIEPVTSLFENGLLRKAIVHPTQFLGFEFISTEKFLLFSNENFESIEKYLNLKHTRAAIEVDSSPRFKILLFSSVHPTLFYNYVEGCLEYSANVRACLYLF